MATCIGEAGGYHGESKMRNEKKLFNGSFFCSFRSKAMVSNILQWELGEGCVQGAALTELNSKH